MKTLKQLFDESKAKWGMTSQIIMFMEEANEASVEASHLLREKPDALLKFAEELADLQFMIDEMVYYFKNDIIESVNKSFFQIMINERKFKEQRLAERLEEKK
jgi:hypothetical protein